MDVAILIVAGGVGSRIGADMPKQYIEINGKSILRRTIECFYPAHKVMVVINPDHLDMYCKAVEGLELLPYANGGETRQESVKKGLLALEKYSPSKVLIHDAARPFVEPRIVDEMLQALEENDAVDLGVDLNDTIKRKPEFGIEVLDRSTLYATQTPQGFDYKKILAWHLAASPGFTDDISIAIANGAKVGLVKGSHANFKITTAHDISQSILLTIS